MNLHNAITENNELVEPDNDNESSSSMKAFNTAIVTTRCESIDNHSDKLSQLVSSPAFNAILSSIEKLATSENISKDQAAAELIKTFREIDSIWNSFIFQEGLSKLQEMLK